MGETGIARHSTNQSSVKAALILGLLLHHHVLDQTVPDSALSIVLNVAISRITMWHVNHIFTSFQ